MKHNYHTHTVRCRHAKGTEREYIEAALEMGLETLGFADHAPQFFEGDYYSTMRMYPEQLPDYAETLRALKWEYRDRIDIRIGLETEYYPQCFERLLALARENGIEYFIMGQHFLGWEKEYSGAVNVPDQEARLDRYIDQTREGLKTGLFSYFAHPNLIRFSGDDAVYRAHMLPYLRELKDMGIPLEVNFLGLTDNRHYPSKRFFALAEEVGNTVIYGIDAHSPGAILNAAASEAKADTFCAEIGVTPFTGPLTLKPIG